MAPRLISASSTSVTYSRPPIKLETEAWLGRGASPNSASSMMRGIVLELSSCCSCCCCNCSASNCRPAKDLQQRGRESERERGSKS